MPKCRIKRENLGWLLTFPDDSKAGLMFFDRGELDEFITSCGLKLTRDFELNRVTECPQYWLDRARIFQPTF